ncbi:MAG TPA: methylamine utilization protein MauJ [Candidatus Binatia bacterium]|jgi:hypothetical protein
MEVNQSAEVRNWTIRRSGPQGEARVEEHQGQKFFSHKAPAEFEGRRFHIELARKEAEFATKGRFRVSYSIYNPFAVFDDLLTIWSEVRQATNIKVSKEIAEETLEFLYSVDDQKPSKVAGVSFGISSGGFLERLIIFLDGDVENMLDVSDHIAANILDFLSLTKQTPIDVRAVSMSDVDSRQPVQQILLVPYRRSVELSKDDISQAFAVPKALIPLLRLLREARNSTNPYYQLLCLFRIYEGLKKKIRADNFKKLGRNPAYPKPKRRVPENDFTRQYFQRWIGRPFEEFLDWVEHNFRDSIAHLVRKDPSARVPDPSSTKHALMTDRVNSMQISMLQVMILDEWEFMKKNGIA